MIAISLEKTGENIKQKVQDREISIPALSKKLGGVSTQAIYKWFRGECLPSLDNLFLLKEILDLESIEELVIVDMIEK